MKNGNSKHEIKQEMLRTTNTKMLRPFERQKERNKQTKKSKHRQQACEQHNE